MTILSDAETLRSLVDKCLYPYRFNLNGEQECDLCSKPAMVTVYSNGCKYHYCHDCNDARREDDTPSDDQLDREQYNKYGPR